MRSFLGRLALSVSSYFYPHPVLYIEAWIFWSSTSAHVGCGVPAGTHDESDCANVVIKQAFRYFGWELAKPQGQLASMVLSLPRGNLHA